MPFDSAIPNRPSGTDARSIAPILANFDDLSSDIEEIANALGVSENGKVWRGKSINSGAEATTATSPTLLSAPDQVSNIWVPSDGLLQVAFRCRVVNPVGAGSINLRVDGVDVTSGGSVVAATGLTFSSYTNLYTNGGASGGLGVGFVAGGTSLEGTNALLTRGGFLSIVLHSGPHTVGVYYSVPGGGNMSIYDRRLYVESRAF